MSTPQIPHSRPIDDDVLRRRIETRLLSDPRLSSQRVDVSVQHGCVTLAGTVQSYRRQLVAHEIAASTEGCMSLINRLKVNSADSLPDARIADRIRAALSSNGDVTKETIAVTVCDGRVTLRGAVSSSLERAIAEDIARGIAGVHGVNNFLQPVIESRIGHEELANAIKASLQRVPGLSECDVGVTVCGNSVTLHGRVRRWSQRQSAESAARRFGLLHVRNEIRVGGHAARAAAVS